MPESTDKLVQQTDPRETLGEVLRAIRRNGLRVAFTTALFLMLGLFLTMLWPNKYESETTFALRDWQVVSDAVLLDDLQDIPLPKKVKALENELKSRKRIEKVMAELQWPEWQDTAGKEADRRELALKLGKNLTVELIPDPTGTQNISVAFRWTSAVKAKDFVNRLRDSWIALTMEGHKKSLEDAARRMESVLSDRKADYEAALAAKRTYQRENRVPALNTEDVNNEIKGEMVLARQVAEAELEAVQSEIGTLSEQLRLIPMEAPAPVPPDTEEQAAALAALLEAESALEEAKDPISGYTALHWKRIKAQKAYDLAVAALVEAGGTVGEERMQMQTNPEWFALAGQLDKAQAKEREKRGVLASIQKAADEAQANLDRLPQVMQDVAQLDTDIAIAENLLATAQTEIQPLREKVLQWRSTNFGTDSAAFAEYSNSPFEILEFGVEPEHPVLPISAIIMAVALILGLGVGALGPVLAEFTRSSFGTVKDVSRSLGVPVLGAVDLILTARDVRARRVQQALTWATMALVLLSLATGLYIYSQHPEVLPTALRRTLRDVRMALT
jgi:uncharacterized protein involved in exopolysaccharide biosynthesis